jgi:hypothetical protein
MLRAKHIIGGSVGATALSRDTIDFIVVDGAMMTVQCAVNIVGFRTLIAFNQVAYPWWFLGRNPKFLIN